MADNSRDYMDHSGKGNRSFSQVPSTQNQNSQYMNRSQLFYNYNHIFIKNKYSLVVFSCHLPPKESVWSDVTNLYAHLNLRLYELDYVNNIFICGDLNSRFGKTDDFS